MASMTAIVIFNDKFYKAVGMHNSEANLTEGIYYLFDIDTNDFVSFAGATQVKISTQAKLLEHRMCPGICPSQL